MEADVSINSRWGELGQMDRAALRVAWAAAFGDAPPHFLSMILSGGVGITGTFISDVVLALTKWMSSRGNTLSHF